ncbi:MAG: hypothetical protein K0R88_2153 [Solirubrobacterales bacterium]|jgi:hypothetical protein|nr:hypothetical protein [Solirubrobacterales bacterium]
MPKQADEATRPDADYSPFTSASPGFHERADGSQVEVYVDGSYDAVGSAGDDDSGAEEEGAEDDD